MTDKVLIPMKHPSNEELIEFLYDELSPAKQTEIARHLNACDECRSQIASWDRVRGQLQTWKLPQPVTAPHRYGMAGSVLRWAVAAAVLLSIGFGLARHNAPNLAQIREEIRREVRGALKQELGIELARHVDETARCQESLRVVASRIAELERQRIADYSGLRGDVETVAIRTQEEFDRLASAQPQETSIPSLDR